MTTYEAPGQEFYIAIDGTKYPIGLSHTGKMSISPYKAAIEVDASLVDLRTKKERVSDHLMDEWNRLNSGFYNDRWPQSVIDSAIAQMEEDLIELETLDESDENRMEQLDKKYEAIVRELIDQYCSTDERMGGAAAVSPEL
jgi:hypothetical protein